MHALYKMKAISQFLLLSFSLLSCQQIMDIIKPEPPETEKPACRVVETTLSDGSIMTYRYDGKGRVSGTVREVVSQEEELFIGDAFSYNEKDQVVKQVQTQPGFGFTRTFTYDPQGRMSRVVTDHNWGEAYDTDDVYTYQGNTINVKTSGVNPIWGDKMWESTYFLENGNIVKKRQDVAEDGIFHGFERNYTYSTLLNPLPQVIKQLYLVEPSGEALYSKNLISQSQDKEYGTSRMEWTVNEKGFPLMGLNYNEDGSFSQFMVFTYSCEEN